MDYFPRPNKKFFNTCLEALRSDDESLRQYAVTAFAHAYPRTAIVRELNSAFFLYNFHANEFLRQIGYATKSPEEQNFALAWLYRQEIAPYKINLLFTNLCASSLIAFLTDVLNYRQLTKKDLKTRLAQHLVIQAAQNPEDRYFHELTEEILLFAAFRFRAYQEAVQPTKENKLKRNLDKFVTKNKRIEKVFNTILDE